MNGSSAGCQGGRNAANWLSRGGIRRAARFLLHHVKAGTMTRPILTAFAIWTISCVIPTPLEAEQTGRFPPPVITKGSPDFLDGTIHPMELNAEIALAVTASDQNKQVQLFSKFYRLLPNQMYDQVGASPMQPVSTPQGAQLAVQKAEIDQTLCLTASGQELIIYVYVADQGFPEMPMWDPHTSVTSPSPNFDGDGSNPPHYDFRSWTVQCP